MNSLLAAVVVVAGGLSTSPAAASPSRESPGAKSPDSQDMAEVEAAEAVSPLRAHLTRPVARSAHHLDHGVIGFELGLGYPHVYRLGLAVGLFDRLTIGATAHWLPGQTAPGWSPTVALAFYRGPRLELGATYYQLLFPPETTEGDEDGEGSSDPFAFERRAHYLMGTISFAQAWFTAGVDLGWARGREADPFPQDTLLQDPEAPPYFTRDRFAGGLHLRVGTRRVGLVMRGLFPYPMVELALGVRFGAFEMRSRGEWWRW